MGSTQTASIRETIEITELNPNQVYANVFSLNQFARASSLAPFFKWYKATKVIYNYEPLYNTFQEGLTPGPTVPYFYSVMNRTQTARPATLSDVQATGSMPIKFTKKITKSYKPNWCSGGLLTGAPIQGSPQSLQAGLYQNGLKPEYGWLMSPEVVVLDGSGSLSTPIASDQQALNGMTVAQMLPVNTNQTVLNGHDIYIEQNGAPSGATVCKLTVTVHWVFKDPNNHNGFSEVNTIVPKPTDA